MKRNIFILLIVCSFLINLVYAIPIFDSISIPEEVYKGDEFNIDFEVSGTNIERIYLFLRDDTSYTSSYECNNVNNCNGNFNLAIEEIGLLNIRLLAKEADNSKNIVSYDVNIKAPTLPTIKEFGITSNYFVNQNIKVDYSVNGINLRNVYLQIKKENSIINTYSSTCSGNSCEGDFEFILNNPGNYDLILIVEDNYNSKDIKSKNIEILPNLLPTFNKIEQPTEIYVGEDFISEVEVKGSELSQVSMSIRNQDNEIIYTDSNSCSADSCESTFEFTFGLNGNFDIIYVAKDSHGSKKIESKNLKVLPRLIPNFVTLEVTEEIETSEELEIIYSLKGYNLDKIDIFTRTFGSLNFEKSITCSAFSCEGTENLNFNSPGEYTLILVGKDDFGSKVQESRNFRVVSSLEPEPEEEPEPEPEEELEPEEEPESESEEEPEPESEEEPEPESEEELEPEEEPEPEPEEEPEPEPEEEPEVLTLETGEIITQDYNFTFIPNIEFETCHLYFKKDNFFEIENSITQIIKGEENNITYNLDNTKKEIEWKIGCVKDNIETNSTTKNFKNNPSKILIEEVQIRYQNNKRTEVENFDIDDIFNKELTLKNVDKGSSIRIDVYVKNLGNTDFDDGRVIIDSFDFSEVYEEELPSRNLDRTSRLSFNFDLPDLSKDFLKIQILAESANDLDTINLEIELEKPRGYIIDIKNIQLTKEILTCSRSTSLTFEYADVGSEEIKDANLKIYSDELGINYVEEGISLSDNYITKNFNLDIGDDKPRGTYDLEIEIYGDKEFENSKEIFQLILRDCETQETNPILNNNEELETFEEETIPENISPVVLTSQESKPEKKSNEEIAQIMLLVGGNLAAASTGVFMLLKLIKII